MLIDIFVRTYTALSHNCHISTDKCRIITVSDATETVASEEEQEEHPILASEEEEQEESALSSRNQQLVLWWSLWWACAYAANVLAGKRVMRAWARQ